MSKFDELGRELPSPDKVEFPLDFRRPPTLQEQIQRMIATHMSMYAEDQGQESFEEADDFDVMEEDGLPFSPHELDADQERLTHAEFKEFVEERDKRIAAEKVKGVEGKEGKLDEAGESKSEVDKDV